MRRAHNVTYIQEKSQRNVLSVMAAPICPSAKLTVNTMCKKAARAVFIIPGMQEVVRMLVSC